MRRGRVGGMDQPRVENRARELNLWLALLSQCMQWHIFPHKRGGYGNEQKVFSQIELVSFSYETIVHFSPATTPVEMSMPPVTASHASVLQIKAFHAPAIMSSILSARIQNSAVLDAGM